jgi:hypothetical protein
MHKIIHTNGTEDLFSSIEDAKASFLGCLTVDGIGAARLVLHVPSFATLADYIAALNIEADWAAANPKPGTWIGHLTDDLDHWAAIDVTTPEDLAAYLDACVAREIEKDRY